MCTGNTNIEGEALVGDLARAENDVVNNLGEAQAADVVKVNDTTRNTEAAFLQTRYGLENMYLPKILNHIRFAQQLSEAGALIDSGKITAEQHDEICELARTEFDRAEEQDRLQGEAEIMVQQLAQIFGPGAVLVGSN